MFSDEDDDENLEFDISQTTAFLGRKEGRGQSNNEENHIFYLTDEVS
jgi:hypothetical protein